MDSILPIILFSGVTIVTLGVLNVLTLRALARQSNSSELRKLAEFALIHVQAKDVNAATEATARREETLAYLAQADRESIAKLERDEEVDPLSEQLNNSRPGTLVTKDEDGSIRTLVPIFPGDPL